MKRLLFAVLPLAIGFLASMPGQAACPERSAAQAIVAEVLPSFSVADERPGQETCAKVVVGDFNGDGTSDYAAVLSEKIAPRQYSDGTPRYSSYVVVFITTELPYADHQAVILLGHSSVPKRINLEVEPGQRGRTRLVVKNASYSRTVYEWGPNGFSVISHDAD